MRSLELLAAAKKLESAGFYLALLFTDRPSYKERGRLMPEQHHALSILEDKRRLAWREYARAKGLPAA